MLNFGCQCKFFTFSIINIYRIFWYIMHIYNLIHFSSIFVILHIQLFAKKPSCSMNIQQRKLQCITASSNIRKLIYTKHVMFNDVEILFLGSYFITFKFFIFVPGV